MAGAAAARERKPRNLVPAECDSSMLYLVPQRINRNACSSERVFFFRASRDMDHAKLTVTKGEKTLAVKTFSHLRPPEMERLSLTFPAELLCGCEPVRFHLEENET